MKKSDLRRSSCHTPSTLGSKNLPAGLSNVPLRECARRYIRRRRSVSGMWRRVRGEVLDMTISRVPRAWSPERKSGEEEGFRHFLEACWSGDMVSISPPSFGGVRARTPPKTQKQWNQGQGVPTRVVNVQTFSGDSLNA